MIKHKFLSAVSAVALLGSVAAHADVTITIGGVAAAVNNGLTSAYATMPGFVVQDFNAGGPGLPAGYVGNGQLVSGDNPNVYAQPTGSGSAFNNTQYLTVPTATPGSVVITSPVGGTNYFGLFWGTIDTYNTITFSRGNVFSKTISGQTVIDEINKTRASNDQYLPGRPGAFYVNFFGTNGDTFDTITLFSERMAFESDNHVFGVVPVPGSALLLLSGVLGAGFIARRRKPAAA